MPRLSGLFDSYWAGLRLIGKNWVLACAVLVASWIRVVVEDELSYQMTFTWQSYEPLVRSTFLVTSAFAAWMPVLLAQTAVYAGFALTLISDGARRGASGIMRTPQRWRLLGWALWIEICISVIGALVPVFFVMTFGHLWLGIYGLFLGAIVPVAVVVLLGPRLLHIAVASNEPETPDGLTFVKVVQVAGLRLFAGPIITILAGQIAAEKYLAADWTSVDAAGWTYIHATALGLLYVCGIAMTLAILMDVHMTHRRGISEVF